MSASGECCGDDDNSMWYLTQLIHQSLAALLGHRVVDKLARREDVHHEASLRNRASIRSTLYNNVLQFQYKHKIRVAIPVLANGTTIAICSVHSKDSKISQGC